MSVQTWNISCVEGWKRVAEHVASKLRQGDILAVRGPLGAGKTTFVQALASELGAERAPKSPTFSMLRTYQVDHHGLRRLLHVDAYRIENESDLLPLDLDAEREVPGTVLAIEWPERIPAWLARQAYYLLTIELRAYGRRAKFTSQVSREDIS